eukprot:GEMP01028562.1.p1 GENE.GEMP01028562.1~~GEMP01028562.1.p1  ORF type:complete len:262 (+),score=63.62 GEMP01028562.1:195-980(+)
MHMTQPHWVPSFENTREDYVNQKIKWVSSYKDWDDSWRCTPAGETTTKLLISGRRPSTIFQTRLTVVPMSDRIHSSDLFFGDYEFDGYDFRGNPRWRSSGQVVIEMRELVGWVFATPERVVKNIGNSFAKLPNLAQWDGWLLRPAHKIANSDEFQMKYASKDYSSSIAPEKKHAASKSSMARLPYGDQKETRFASETEMVSSFGGNPRIFARFGGGHALLPFREAEDATKISMPFGDFYVSRRMEDIDKVVLNESRYQIIR